MRYIASVSAFRLACRVCLGVALAGCAADSLVLPSEGEPAQVSVVQGSDQQGMAGSALSESLTVKITDSQNRPVVQQAVGFILTGGGAVNPAVVVTDGEGMVRFRWILGPAAGQQSLVVGISSEGTLAPKTTVTATARPGPADGIERIRGNGQIGQAGLALAESLVVRLVDEFGNPVPNSDVTWHPADGTVDRLTTPTDGAGLAAVSWTLGGTAGGQSVAASYGGAVGSSIQFDATATPGAPPRLAVVTQPSAAVQSGQPFSQQPSVRLETSQGTPIHTAGVSITAAIGSGAGSLTGTTTIATDANGVAQFTDLVISGAAGIRTLIFAAAGRTAATSDPIVVSSPTPSATRSSLVAAPTTIQAGSENSTITVTVRDDSDQPVPGVAVTIAVSGGGNTIHQPVGTTNSAGVTVASFSSATAESKVVTATAGGVAITQTASVTVAPVGGGPSAGQTSAKVPGGRRFNWTTIVITTRDASGNPLTQGGFASQIQVKVSGSNVASPSVVDNRDGTYSASYFPLFKGNDQIAITLGGTPIQGSPYQSKVK